MRDALERVLGTAWPRILSHTESLDFGGADLLGGDLTGWSTGPNTSAPLSPAFSTRPPALTESPAPVSPAATDHFFAQMPDDASLADAEWLPDTCLDDA
jgi:hypothetical protein